MPPLRRDRCEVDPESASCPVHPCGNAAMKG
jgi:hypothetical protein